MTAGMLPRQGTPIEQALEGTDRHAFIYPQFAKNLPPRAGVYLVLYGYSGDWHVIDVGRAEDLWQEITHHPHWGCWERVASFFGPLAFATEIAPFSSDMQEQMAQRIRSRCTSLPCG